MSAAMPSIEHGIPMPAQSGRGKYRRKKWSALFARMKPGDSFQVGAKKYRAARISAYCGGVAIITAKLSTDRFRIWKV